MLDPEENMKNVTSRPSEFRSPQRKTNLGKIFEKFDPKTVSSKVNSFRPTSSTYKELNFVERNKKT